MLLFITLIEIWSSNTYFRVVKFTSLVSAPSFHILRWDIILHAQAGLEFAR